MKNKLSPSEWRRHFLINVAKKLDRSVPFQSDCPPLENAKMAEKYVGLPVNLWMEITEDHDSLVPATKQEEFRFLAGLVVGWREAKIRFEQRDEVI